MEQPTEHDTVLEEKLKVLDQRAEDVELELGTIYQERRAAYQEWLENNQLTK